MTPVIRGQSYFNEYTGKVTHITDDIAFGGNFPGVDIKHVNDTSFKGVQSGFGKGWTLNICETVSLVSGNGLAEKYKVRYRDEDGTEIYFCRRNGRRRAFATRRDGA